LRASVRSCDWLLSMAETFTRKWPIASANGLRR
jgi:hypothetical protein